MWRTPLPGADEWGSDGGGVPKEGGSVRDPLRRTYMNVASQPRQWVILLVVMGFLLVIVFTAWVLFG